MTLVSFAIRNWYQAAVAVLASVATMSRYLTLLFSLLASWPIHAATPPAGELWIEFARAEHFEIEVDRLGLAGDFPGLLRTLPPLELSLAAEGTVLLPAQRLPLPSTHPVWQLLAGEGRWQRDGTGGLGLQLPLNLLEQGANCIHYGELTVALEPGGSAGQAEFIVTGQTCEYFKFRARYHGDAVWRADEVERLPVHESRFPVSTLEELRRETGIDPGQLAPPAGVSAEHLTVAGLLLDGRHYQSDCTVQGSDARRCQQLPLPTFSLSKSLLAGVALMRLERLVPGSSQRTIAELLPACGEGWRDVTILQALNMQTGRFDHPGYFEDEEAAIASPLFLAPGHREKLAWACGAYPRREAPGQRWVYHSSDTYVAVTAMAALLREYRDGQEADIYSDLLYRELWSDLALSPLAAFTRRTADEVGQPYGGWGQLLTADDLLQLGLWLSREARAPQLLDAMMIRAAVMPSANNPGVAAGDGGLRYRHGFWLLNATAALGCEAPYWIPFMSGHGGITLALLNPDTIYYYVSDNDEFRWLSAVSAVHRAQPLCS